MMHEWPTENWPFSTCRRKTPLPEQQQGTSTGFLLHGSTRKWTFVCRLFCQWKCSATTNLDWLRSRLFLWYFGRDECCSGDTSSWVLCSPKANSLRLFSVLWLSTKPSNCLHPSDFRELNSSNEAWPWSAYCLCSQWCAISGAIPDHLGTERDPNYYLTGLSHVAVRLSDEAFSSVGQIYEVWFLFSLSNCLSFCPFLSNMVISTHSLEET